MSEPFDLIIRNARILDRDKIMDIAIKDDKIVLLEKGIKSVSIQELDAERRLTSPGFVDAHMHLDHAFMGEDEMHVHRTLAEAAEITVAKSRVLTLEDFKRNAKKALKMALRKGTTALRTNVSLNQVTGIMPLKALLELREECSTWMDIQIVALVNEFPFTTSEAGESLLRQAMSLGADVVGGLSWLDPNPEKYLDIIFNVAKDFESDIDLHVDESNNPQNLTLGIYAEKALKEGYQGRVTAGHCCSLSAVGDEVAEGVIGKVRDAKMNIVANPFDNLYIWGEDGRPLGVTRVGELLDAGVNVIYATDSTRDIFDHLANADMLLAGFFLAYLTQLDGKDALTNIFKMGTSRAAKATRIIQNYGIEVDGKADLMILDAESLGEAIIEQAKRSYVIKNGKIVVENGKLAF